MTALDAVFKAYDVRGIVPDQLDARACRAIGWAFARFAGTPRLVVARDMRASGEALSSAFIAGARVAGADVVDIGLASTDTMYFASGRLDAPGAMFTASHNPAAYNGIKFCLAGAKPVGQDSGLGQIRQAAEEAIASGADAGEEVGGYEKQDFLSEYAGHVRSFVDVAALRPLRIVADTANGMGGLVAPEVFAGLPFDVTFLFPELDGTFPNHPADPIQPENLVDLKRSVLEHGADVGLAFDGDADRVIAVDAGGNVVDGDRLLALFATDLVERGLLAGATVVATVMANLGFHQAMGAAGVKVHTVGVGDRYVLEALDANGWALGGEQSGHIIFRSLATTGDGVLSGLLLADLVHRKGASLGQQAAAALHRFPQVLRNVAVADRDGLAGAAAVWEEVGRTERLLGHRGRVLLRPSGTEPLVRVMVEAPTEEEAEAVAERLVDALHSALGGPEAG